ncbi:MAG: hypothetical protein JHC74_15720, partial [Thermoleophilia bacterium]|nr:hypothetical protein [Thermoleophilia bacterium]
MIQLDDQVIERLARQFHPVLRFHEAERFFPVLAESWLTTATNGVWPESPHRDVQLGSRPDDPSRRGAALCTADNGMTAVTALTGAPVGGDRPVSFEVGSDDPMAMLSDLVRSIGADGFLDVGGWRPDASRPFGEGDIDYLTSLCSELASGVNPRIPWTPADASSPAAHGVGAPVVPWQWVAQPTHPTMYCEVNWGGAWARRAAKFGSREYPPGERALDQTVAFTYHLLYGARDPGGEGRRSEGQWEAITVFFRAEIGGRDGDGELIGRGGMIAEEPFAVVASQGQDRAVGAHFTEFRAYSRCEKLGVRPVIYVTRGSHRNLFAPVTGETFNPGDYGPHAPDTGIRDQEPGSWDGMDGYLIISGIALGLAALLPLLLMPIIGWIGAIMLAVILVIVALIFFIMWIVSACREADDRDAGEQVSPGSEPNEAGTTGPQSGGDGSEEPAAPAPGSSGGSSTPPAAGSGAGPSVGLPNSGSPTGNETTFPDIRIVERLFAKGASRKPTPFPSESTMENPTWWDYRGRWGVRVKPAIASGTWESGWQRVDDQGRDWSYFCGEALLVAMH